MLNDLRLKTLTVVLYVALFLAMPATAETLKLTDPDAIIVATELSDRIDDLSAKVMACIDDHGGDHEPCICADACNCPFKAEYTAAEGAFREALTQHPEWQDRMIHFTRPGDPLGYNLAFDGLARQFGATCRE